MLNLTSLEFNCSLLVNSGRLYYCASADDSKLDGFNASFGLLDEYHCSPNSKVRDVIKSSMGMRENPHLCTITTITRNCFRNVVLKSAKFQ